MARMVPWVMATSYDLPVRLSVMVRVSRDEEEASAFLVVVALDTESMRKPQQQRRKSLLYHCTPKGRLPEMVCSDRRKWPAVSQVNQMARSPKPGGNHLSGLLHPVNRVSIVVITTTIAFLSAHAREAIDDRRSQERRTRPRQPRLAQYPLHVFFRRLL